MNRSLVSDIVEAYQRGRRNNLSEIEGRTVVAVEDVGKVSIKMTFDDGSILEVSGKTWASEDAIYYKLYRPANEGKKVSKKELMARFGKKKAKPFKKGK